MTSYLAFAGVPAPPALLAVPLVLGHAGVVTLVLVSVKVLRVQHFYKSWNILQYRILKYHGQYGTIVYLETINASEFVAVSALLRVVLLNGRFLELLTACVTCKVDHLCDLSVNTDNETA